MISYITRSWSIPKSLTLIAGLFLVPSVFQLGVYVQARLEAIHGTNVELEGARLTHQAWTYISGVTEDKAPDKSELKTALSAKADWPDVQAAMARLESAETSIARIDRALDLIPEIAEHSGLALDPAADTYYLQLIFTDEIVKLRGALVHLSVADADRPAQETLVANMALANDKILQLKNAAADFEKNDATGVGKRELTPRIDEISQHWGKVFGEAQKVGFAPEKLSPAFKGDVAKLAQTVDSTALLAADLFKDLSSGRNSATYSSILWITGILAVLTLLSAFLAYRVSNAMTGRLASLISVMDAISRKDTSVSVPHQSDSNEYGAIARALEKFREGVFENANLTSSAVKSAEQQKAESDFYARQHEIFMSAFEGAANRMAKGDFSHRILEKVIPEYEPIIEQMNIMMGRLEAAQREKMEAEANINTAVSSLANALAELANGNLDATIDQDVAKEFEKLKSDFNSAAKELQNTIRLVKEGAENIKTGTVEISQASDDLSRRTENQAASLEQTAAAVKEITDTVKRTAEGASHARDTVSAAKTDAEKSGEVVRRAIEAMNAIENSSKQISQIIGVIDEIAFQTNLLALNAGVEAARAGDAGRGFAVVASEVRALAQRSAEAAKEIKGLISASTSQVAQGVQLVGETGKSLTRIVDQVGNINGIVSQIASSAHEQALGLGQVNTAIGEMDQVTQQNAAMVEEATAATQTLSRQTEELARLVSRFRAGEVRDADVKMRREPAKPSIKTNGKSAHTGKTNGANGANGSHKFATKAASHDVGWEDF